MREKGGKRRVLDISQNSGGKRGGRGYNRLASGSAQKSIKAISVSRRDSSSSIPLTSCIKFSRFSTILNVGRRMGDNDGEGEGACRAVLRGILNPRLVITDLDLVIFD
jgi:hypothetical protein